MLEYRAAVHASLDLSVSVHRHESCAKAYVTAREETSRIQQKLK